MAAKITPRISRVLSMTNLRKNKKLSLYVSIVLSERLLDTLRSCAHPVTRSPLTGQHVAEVTFLILENAIKGRNMGIRKDNF